MSNDTALTIVGNLTGDPELGFTPNGAAWARFSIAATPRRYDQASGGWVDGETLFLRCTAWRDLAEHVTESLHKGQRVIATGRLRQSSWQTEGGETRTALQLDVDELGPSLRWATARVTRIARDTGTPDPGVGDRWSRPTPNGETTEQTPVPAGATQHQESARPVPQEPPF